MPLDKDSAVGADGNFTRFAFDPCSFQGSSQPIQRTSVAAVHAFPRVGKNKEPFDLS